MSDIEETEWFSNADFSAYEGKYIATIGKSVAAFGDNAKLVRDEARRKFPNDEPIIFKIPTDDLLVILLTESDDERILRRTKEAEKAYRDGDVKIGSFEDFWKDMND